MADGSATVFPNGWRKVRAEEIALQQKGAIVSGPFGSNIGERFFVESGIPVIRGSNLTLGVQELVDKGYVFITDEKAYELRNCDAVVGDIVFTAAGTLGQVGRIHERTAFPRYIVSNKQLRLRPDPAVADSKFLYYWFASPWMQRHLQNQNTGASIPLISLSTLRSLPVNLPPLPIQRRIAGILSAYEELIENSQRRITILGEMARVIYREWFVRFRFPGHEGCRFVGSPLGEIPEGWEVCVLGDIAEQVRRAVPKGEMEGLVPYVGLEHIPRRSLALDSWDTVDVLGSNKLAFREGEVLFGKIRPYFHKVCVAPFDGVCSADTIVLRARRPEEYATMVACVSSDALVAEATATANGAKMPRASWDVLRRYQVVVPAGDAAKRFSDLLHAVTKLQSTLVFQIRNLRQTRDLLLPRLLSGQTDVEALEP